MAETRVTITVAGRVGSGKTCIATKLKEVLTAAGFQVELDDNSPPIDAAELNLRLNNLACSMHWAGQKIEINTITTLRRSSNG